VRPLALVGSLSLDRVDGGPRRIGGGAYHGGRGLRLLAAQRGRIVAKCAQADRRELLPRLVALGLPVTLWNGGSTHVFSIRYDGDARVMEVESVGDPWQPREVAAALAGAAAVHVAPLLRSDFSPETLAEIARGRRVSLDGQGLVRPARTGPLELDRDFDPGLLEHVSILKLAEEEARVLVGEPDESALAELAVPEVVVTLGRRGALVFADGRLERVEARPVPTADPTGAGDAFSVAYLAARSDGQAPAAAARRATALVAALLAGQAR
jgi:sugar/nucleoside kinase (ribokinase family)